MNWPLLGMLAGGMGVSYVSLFSPFWSAGLRNVDGFSRLWVCLRGVWMDFLMIGEG